MNRALLAELARRTPLLPGKDVLEFVDIDSMQKRVYGHHKQGAAYLTYSWTLVQAREGAPHRRPTTLPARTRR